jgi:hypothetical protein
MLSVPTDVDQQTMGNLVEDVSEALPDFNVVALHDDIEVWTKEDAKQFIESFEALLEE